MTDEEFLALVNSDSRSQASPEESALLRRPENLRRWQAVLGVVSADVQDMHAIRKARLEEAQAKVELGLMKDAEFAELRMEIAGWKARVRRFERGLNDRLRECRGLLNESAGMSAQLATIARRAVETWEGHPGPHDQAIQELDCALATIGSVREELANA